jgi:hypothetical protein
MPRYAVLSLLLTHALAFAQTNVLTVGRTQTVKAKIGSTVEVKLPLVLRPGFHVNSNPAADKYLIPLQLSWDPGVLGAASVAYPKPVTEKYPFYPVPLLVYSGTFEVTTTFRVAPTAAPGPAAINGKLRYQACNDRECLQPKTMNVALQVDLVR